jgi:hypothetical protein
MIVIALYAILCGAEMRQVRAVVPNARDKTPNAGKNLGSWPVRRGWRAGVRRASRNSGLQAFDPLQWIDFQGYSLK